MKNNTKLTICIFLLIVTLFALTACDDKPQPKQLTDLTLPTLKDNEMAVIVKNGDGDYTQYIVNLTKLDVTSPKCEHVLNYLHDEANLVVAWEDGGYGKYLTGIGSISQGDGKYVFVYTSNLDYESAWASSTPYELEGGVKLVEASVGVTDLPVVAGDIVYFELGTYNF